MGFLKKKKKLRDFPSFWRPDFSRKEGCRLQDELFSRFGNLVDANLVVKCQYWMCYRNKVLETIRIHRSTTATSMRLKVIEGKFIFDNSNTFIIIYLKFEQNKRYLYFLNKKYDSLQVWLH
jgi:hypothetical protein